MVAPRDVTVEPILRALVMNIHELPKTHLVIRSLVLAVESDG